MEFDEDEEEYLGLRPTRRFPHSENDPLLSNVYVPRTERVDKMIEGLKERCPPIERPTIYPFFDSETYIFIAGLKGEQAEEVRRSNPPLIPIERVPRKPFNKYNVPEDPDWVKVDIKVRGSVSGPS
jgi:hypothetical protein